MKYTLKFRLWHWINAFVVLGLLGTVFLRKTFLSWRTNSELLTSKLAEMGIDITQGQAEILAKSLRVRMWEWHNILGYILIVLILFRVYLFFRDKSPRESFRSLDLHKKAVVCMYYAFNIMLVFMAVTGIAIKFYEPLGLTKEFARQIKDIHELAFYTIMIFVPIHIIGVVVADNTKEKGIISSIVNGKE